MADIAAPNGMKRRHDTESAAKYLGTSVSTLTKWRSSGKGPRYIKRSGGRVFYDEADLDAYDVNSKVETVDSRRAA